MTQKEKVRGCAIDNSPQLMAVCIISDHTDAPVGITKDELIVMYNRWLDHRCRCDRLKHPNSKYDLTIAVKLDLQSLESLSKYNRYIVRFRTKPHNKLNTKKYGQLKICFNSSLKVYAKYNIFRDYLL